MISRSIDLDGASVFVTVRQSANPWHGQPEDAAATYLFAMQNPYLTGQVLSVDGGSSII